MFKVPKMWGIGQGCPVCGSRDYFEVREEVGTHDSVQATYVVECVCGGCSVKFDDPDRFGGRKGWVACCGKEDSSDVGRDQGQDRQGP